VNFLLFMGMLYVCQFGASPFGEAPSGHQSRGSLTGRLLSGNSDRLNRFSVQITSFGGKEIYAEATPDAHGNFDLATPGNGIYQLQVFALDGTVIQTQSLTLPNFGRLEIDLRPAGRSGPRESVSIARLQHKPSKKATQEFALARQMADKGEHTGAIEHLERALSIDPNYFEAMNNLGVEYTHLGKLPEARRIFEQAVQLDGGDAKVEANLAYVLLCMGKPAEAESAARASVRADSTSSRARLYLALSLLQQHKSQKEAIFHLEKAKPELEAARRILSELESRQ